MNLPRGFDCTFIGSVLLHAILPALSLVLVGIGGWFMGMRSLVSNIVTEDYVVYAELGGVSRRRILRSYVMRNALVPQVTGLAMSLGGIFNGAIITEQVFGYPGIGTLLIAPCTPATTAWCSASPRCRSSRCPWPVLLIDLAYPLFDPRVKATLMCARAAAACCATTARSRIGVVLLGIVVAMALASFFVAVSAESTPTSCRRTFRPRGPIRSAPIRAGRTCSGN